MIELFTDDSISFWRASSFVHLYRVSAWQGQEWSAAPVSLHPSLCVTSGHSNQCRDGREGGKGPSGLSQAVR